MELKAEQLLSIVNALQPQKSSASRTEKRGGPRIGVRYSVQLRVLDSVTGIGARAVRCWLRNISSRGLGLACPISPALGSRFVVELPRANGTNMEMFCIVRNCRQVSDDVYHVGASFTAAGLLQQRPRVA